mgnify:FL=1
MAKVGRNQPCPCGSGKKYKRCCWDKDQRAWVDVVNDMPPILEHLAATDELYAIDELDRLSNSVPRLVTEGCCFPDYPTSRFPDYPELLSA